jgi:hypothetical protein
VGVAAPEDVIFARPGGGLDAFPLGIDVVELWAAAPDGSDERLITTYAPATYAEGYTRSPDGRYVVVSDPPGATLIDLQAGEKVPLVALDSTAQRVQNVAWGPESDTLYYAVVTALGYGDGLEVSLWQQSVDPLGGRQPIREAFSVPRADEGIGESAAYPAFVLPDDRLLLSVPQDARFVTWGLYDPVADRLIQLEGGSRTLIIHDAFGAEVVYTENDNSVFLGQITPDGELIETRRLASPADGGGWRYSALAYLPDGRVVAERFNLDAESQLNDRQLVVFGPDGEVLALTLPVEWTGLQLQGPVNAETVLVRLTTPEGEMMHWLVPVDGGNPIRIGG